MADLYGEAEDDLLADFYGEAEIEQTEKLERRIAELEAERDNYKQKTETLIRSHHSLNELVNTLAAERDRLREVLVKVRFGILKYWVRANARITELKANRDRLQEALEKAKELVEWLHSIGAAENLDTYLDLFDEALKKADTTPQEADNGG